MKFALGIDIGSTASSVVLLNEERGVIFSSYRTHTGQILETLHSQLDEVSKFLKKETKPVGSHKGSVPSISIGYTSSCPGIFRTGLKTDTRVAYIRAATAFHKDPEALLIIGGEKFGLVRFGKNGTYQNYHSNTSCAAGTGSFLDQQLSRLNIESITQLGDMAANNSEKFPRIASRCSVFAKTDLIHAQQEGYRLEEICDGLCYGLAKNVVDAVFNEQEVKTLLVAGGVALNRGVMKHLQELTGAQLEIDEYAHLYGAVGAALSAWDSSQPSERIYTPSTLQQLLLPAENEKQFHNPPLELKLSDYPDFKGAEEYLFSSAERKKLGPAEVTLHEKLVKGQKIDCYLGIDIGSTSTKAVILDMKKKVLAGLYTRTSGRPVQAMQLIFEAVDDIEAKHQVQFLVKGAGTTGSGRKLIGKIINADNEPDEITAHARAAVELDPETDTIIEIGGQDSKFTLLRDGIVTLSIMNNVCAAGTGSFIEEQANKLNCPLADYAERASHASSPLTSDRCTVFMERDLNYYLNKGYDPDELLASTLHSVRENYLTKVSGKASIGNKIFFQGATAKNRALVAAFEQKLGKPIMVSKFCHLTGALGVALELHDMDPATTNFRGIGLWKQEIPVRSEVCDLCTNHCKLKIAEVEDETVAYGFLCGRDYETETFVKEENNAFELLKTYRKTFRFQPGKFRTKETPEHGGTVTAGRIGSGNQQITIGLPYALHMTDELYIWQHFFDLLNISTITSESLSTAVKDGKKLADAEFCAPVAAAFGHAQYLSEKADHIFLPLYLENGQHARSSKMYCFYTQYISSMLSSTKEFRNKERILMPLVRSLKSENHMISELTGMMHKIGRNDLTSKEVRSAYQQAQALFTQQQLRWKRHFKESVDEKNVNIILLGRPYTVLSNHMNNKIPEIISKKGYNAFYMDMLPGMEMRNSRHEELVKTMTWKYASLILRSADEVARNRHLYPILITSFKCTPDSFVIEYFREIMDAYRKPYLVLQLDEHDSAVGYETRIEAAIRSFNNHFMAGFNGSPANEQAHELLSETLGIPDDTMDHVGEILEEHDIEPGDFHEQVSAEEDPFNLSDVKTGETSRLKGRKLLMPAWDAYTGKLLEAMLQAAGYDAAILLDTPGTIQRSLNHNTGQCIPLNIVTQNAFEYIRDHQLDPSRVAVWIPRGYMSCNLTMFPHYMKKLFSQFEPDMSDLILYPGSTAFHDFSVKMGVNAYLVYLFSGSIQKVACRLRPYEKEKGAINRVVKQSLDMLYEAFRHQQYKEPVIKEIMHLFDQVEVHPGNRPKVAIFGDIYARDNEVFNQGLVGVIEENGGEVLPTSYSEYLRIILKQTELRLYHEGRYLEHYNLRLLKNLIPLLEGKYNKYFEKYIQNMRPDNSELFDILEKHHLHLLQRGETVDNILKIENLIRSYDDISLFVATNPAYCCPSLVTEAMSANIEKMTGIPVVSIEYDGTMGSRNEDVIPYLQLK